MGFFKSVARIISAPVTVPLKVSSNIVKEVIDPITHDIPIAGGLIDSAGKAMSLPDDIARNKDAQRIQEGAAAAVATGAVAAAGITGGATVGILAGAGFGGGGSLLKQPGVMDGLLGSLGLPPGLLNQFLPQDAPNLFPESFSGGGNIPTQQKIEYGVPAKSNLFPVLAIGGTAAVALILLARRK